MANLLEQLRKMTVVVADTGEINQIEKHRPRDATTNPSLIAKASEMDDYAPMIDASLKWAKDRGGSEEEVLENAVDHLSVSFGAEILKLIDGRVSTEVDARLSYDTSRTMDRAQRILDIYEELGVDQERVLIKIASTWDGIRAADLLEREGIHCNLTLMFGLHQAVACAEAAVTLISPFVGRILDWHQQNGGKQHYEPHEDPGVRSVQEIYTYFKHFNYNTEIMGASFRNLGQITELAGCDLLTIAPKFLHELAQTEGELPRKLSKDEAWNAAPERLEMKKELFDAMHEKDRMAREKLDEGIEGFTQAIIDLEGRLKEKLKAL